MSVSQMSEHIKDKRVVTRLGAIVGPSVVLIPLRSITILVKQSWCVCSVHGAVSLFRVALPNGTIVKDSGLAKDLLL